MAKKDKDKGKGKGKTPSKGKAPQKSKGKGKGKNSPKKPTIDQLFGSMDFKSFSPGLQEAIRVAYDEFDVADLPNLNLTNKEIAGIITKVAKRINPYYEQQENDLFLNYDEAKRSSIDTIKTGIQRESDALARNEQNGREDLAEGNRITLKNLEKTLQKETEDRDRYMSEKKADLQTKIDNSRLKLSQGLGDISEDEVNLLQNEQRRFEQEFKAIQNEEAQRGYAFSGERLDKERYSKEGSNSVMSMTKTEAERLRRDLSQEQEGLVGSEALGSVAGARLRGGIMGSEVVTTNRDIEQAMRNAGVNMQEYLQQYEQQYGTEAAQGLATRYGLSLYGDLEGSENKTFRRGLEDSQRTYQQYADDKVKSFEQDYGSDAVTPEFGQGYGARAGYAGFTPSKNPYGGTAKRIYEAERRDVGFKKNKALTDAIQVKKKGIIGSRKI